MRAIIALSLSITITCTSWSQDVWGLFTGKSVMEVRSGLRHVYQRLGRKDLVAALDSAAVTNLVAGNLKGLDLARPLGTILVSNASGTGTLLTFIPTTGDDAFRGFLARHGLTLSKDQQGNEAFQLPLVGTVYLRFTERHAWLAWRPEELAGQLPSVDKLLTTNHQKNLLAMTLYLERMPVEQRQAWQQRAETGLRWLSGSDKPSGGTLVESVGVPAFRMIAKWLSDDARELTLVAHADTRADQLTARALVTPRRTSTFMDEKTFEVPAHWWAKLRGKSDEVAASAASKAFGTGSEEKLVLSKKGAETVEYSATLSGKLLAYHAALGDNGTPREKRPARRERRRK
ncbi:MAG: hypothetical protein U0796_17410 [Gemmatales bacterium]